MTAYRPLIAKIADDCGLDPNLVEAVVIAESNGYTDAFRWEPEFFDRYLKGKPDYDRYVPRRVGSSYGLMQVMYSTAKDHGFGDLPELLFLPDVGLKFGCLHLARLLKWAEGDVPKALAAYNGGQGNYTGTDPRRYAARVQKLYASVHLAHPTEAV